MCRKKKNTVDQKKSEKMKKKTKNKNKSKTKQRKSQSQTRPTGPRLRGRRPNRFLSLSLSLSRFGGVTEFFLKFIYIFFCFVQNHLPPTPTGWLWSPSGGISRWFFIYFFFSFGLVGQCHSFVCVPKKKVGK